MAAYSLSAKAAVDLDGLYEYTIVTLGLDQARTYLSGLHKRFQTLADHRIQGRSATELAPGLATSRLPITCRILHAQR